MSLQGQTTEQRTWKDVMGAWLGVGTAPGALLLGAGLAERHGGQVPLFGLLLSIGLMFTMLWFQGQLGLRPPFGEGGNLTQITPLYFGDGMQKALGALIALGMTGWFGFNVGLGGAALSALLHASVWVGPLLIGVPVLILSLLGIRQWNRLAILTTISVIVLVILVMLKLAGPGIPLNVGFGDPRFLVTDAAVFIGYVAVFSLRSPDFTAGLGSRRDLLIVDLLLSVPVMLISLAGVSLYRGTGSSDVVAILAAPDGLAIGNLLVTLAVIAPTFTTLYSGAPGLKAAVGMPSAAGMILISVIGILLAVTRFDLLLLSWLTWLAAALPPLMVPMIFESIRRRQGMKRRKVPMWTWLPGSLVSVIFTAWGSQIAPLSGLIVAGVMTTVWNMIFVKHAR